jgi:hypothetical protein
MTVPIEDETAKAVREADEGFDRAQGGLVELLRAEGVPEKDIPQCLADAHHEYWLVRTRVLARIRLLEAESRRT